MKVSEVAKEDAQQIGQIIQALQAGEWKLSVKDAVALVEGVRWLQKLAVEMAKDLQKPAAAPAAPAEQTSDKPGFVVTSYTPGKLGKGKK